MAVTGVDVDPYMRPSDAFSWYMERDPLLRSTVVTVGVLDRAPDPEALHAIVDRATRVVPGMHHVVRIPPLRLATPRWARVDEVDLDWHLQWRSVAPPGGLADVLAIARSQAMTAFDPARPLWSLTVVTGLRDGRAAFVMKFHHALTDGVGGMRLAFELFDLERERTRRPDSPESPAEDLDSLRLGWDALTHDARRLAGAARALPLAALRTTAHSLRHPRASVTGLADGAVSIAKFIEPFRTTMSPVMRKRRLGRGLEILDVPLDGLRRSATAVDGHLNDAFLAAVTGGLRIYHERHESKINRLRVTMPINQRKDSDEPGGNRITLVRFPVPVAMTDVRERMRAIRSLTDTWRAEPSLALTQEIAMGLNVLPSSLIGGMLKHVDFLASNLPGFGVPVYLAGARLDSYYGFGPTIGAAVNITLISYIDTCNIGVNCDTGAIPDTADFAECLRAGFAEVLAVGQKPTAKPPRKTRTPHESRTQQR